MNLEREEQVWGTVSWQRIFSDIPFRLYHDKSFREVGKVERAIPSGSPSPRFSSSLIRDVSLESARRLSSVTRSRLGYVFVVNTYLHEARFTQGQESVAAAQSTCRMYANCVQRGRRESHPLKRGCHRQAVESISLYSRIDDDIIFYDAITFQDCDETVRRFFQTSPLCAVIKRSSLDNWFYNYALFQSNYSTFD